LGSYLQALHLQSEKVSGLKGFRVSWLNGLRYLFFSLKYHFKIITNRVNPETLKPFNHETI